MPESDGERCYRIKHPTEPRADRYTERVEVLLLASDGKPKHPAGPPMTLGNMRGLGVQRLIASCLNDECQAYGADRVSGYPAGTERPSPVLGHSSQLRPRCSLWSAVSP